MTGNSTYRFPVWATFFTLLCVVVLCALGVWQVHRLHWKQGILNDIEQAYEVDASHHGIGRADILAAWNQKRFVLRGTVVGRYLDNKTFKLGPRPRHDRQGFDLYTPLKMLDGGIVLVNRGWIPAQADMPLPPTGVIRVTGLLRKPDAANYFTPANRPADNEWFSVNMAQLAKEKALPDLAPYVLYVEGKDTGALPIPVGQRPHPYNNHRLYAIFWFTMAGVWVLLYVLRFIVPLVKARRAA